jgi:hypothetical protein
MPLFRGLDFGLRDSGESLPSCLANGVNIPGY